MTAQTANPLEAFRTAIKHRYLIQQLVAKELRSKYRKSTLGLAWLIMNPLLLVGAYTLVFGVLLKVRWGGASSTLEFSLILHAGVMFYMFFYEIVSRSATLISNNQSFVTKMVFPLEVFPWVVVIVATINFLVTLAVWTGLSWAIRGTFPAGILWVPVVFIPFALFCAGSCWFLSSLAAYKPDIEHALPVILLMLMYMSPLLFPVEKASDAFRMVISLNPLTWVLESARSALISGQPPSLAYVVAAPVIGMAATWLGYASFIGNKRGFADVF